MSVKRASTVLEKETLFGIYEIIDRMHKHAIKDYIQVIDCYYSEDIEEIKSESEFEKIYSKEFHSMFDHIAEDFKWRLKDLKVELIKRLDIQPHIPNKLDVIEEESDDKPENESDDESESESHNEPNLKTKLFKCKYGNFRYIGPSLKNLQHGCILEPFSKRTNKSDCKLNQKEPISITKPDPEINQKLNSDQMT